MLKCPKCRKEAGTFFYCENCGALIKEECPSCGKVIDASTKFCPKCGKPNRLYPN